MHTLEINEVYLKLSFGEKPPTNHKTAINFEPRIVFLTALQITSLQYLKSSSPLSLSLIGFSTCGLPYSSAEERLLLLPPVCVCLCLLLQDLVCGLSLCVYVCVCCMWRSEGAVVTGREEVGKRYRGDWQRV